MQLSDAQLREKIATCRTVLAALPQGRTGWTENAVWARMVAFEKQLAMPHNARPKWNER